MQVPICPVGRGIGKPTSLAKRAEVAKLGTVPTLGSLPRKACLGPTGVRGWGAGPTAGASQGGDGGVGAPAFSGECGGQDHSSIRARVLPWVLGGVAPRMGSGTDRRTDGRAGARSGAVRRARPGLLNPELGSDKGWSGGRGRGRAGRGQSWAGPSRPLPPQRGSQTLCEWRGREGGRAAGAGGSGQANGNVERQARAAVIGGAWAGGGAQGRGSRVPDRRRRRAESNAQRRRRRQSGRKVDGETIGEAIALSWHHDRGREEEEGGGGRV